MSLKLSFSCFIVPQSLGLDDSLRRCFSALACAFCLAASSLAAWLLGMVGGSRFSTCSLLDVGVDGLVGRQSRGDCTPFTVQ